MALMLAALPGFGAAPDAGIGIDGGFAFAWRPTFKWDVPNVVGEVDIPGLTWAMGVPVKLHAVTVKGKMEDTMRYMYDSFVRQGLFVEPKHQTGPMLTGVDPGTLITYTALFQQNAPGYVTVVLGEANVPKAQRPQGNDFVPLFPGAQGVLRSSFEGVDTLLYMVPDANEEKVRAFYKDILPKSGFEPLPEDGLLYQKADQQVSIRLTRKDGKVSVFATRRGKRAP